MNNRRADRIEPAVTVSQAWPAIAAFIVFAACLLYYAGPSWAMVLYRLVTDGVIVVLWVLSMAGIGSLLIPAADTSKVLRFITSAALGMGIVSLAVLGLGLAGWMNFWTALILIVVGLAISAAHLIKNRHSLFSRDFAFASQPLSFNWEWLWIIVAPLAAISVIGALVPPGLLWGDEPNGYDVVEYHLQVPREWFEFGRIIPLQNNVFSYFPFNTEMHYLLAMHLRGGPWAGMYVAQLMHLAMCALAVTAVYGLAGGGKRGTLAAIAMAVIPWMTLLAPVAYNEGALLFFGTLAIGWALRPGARNLAIAGAMAGFACGVKLTAVPMLLIAIPVALIFDFLFSRKNIFLSPSPGTPGEGRGGGIRSTGVLPVSSGVGHGQDARATVNPHPNPPPEYKGRGQEAHRERGEILCGIGVFFAFGILTFSPWLIRNWIWAHNPVFPEAMGIFGKAHFSDVQVERWSEAHQAEPKYAGPIGHLLATGNQVVWDWRYGFLFLPLAVASAALAWKKPGTRFLAAMLLINCIIWIGFTHLQSRFFVLAIPIGALLIAQVDWGGGWPVIGGVLVAMAVVGGVNLHPKIMYYLDKDRQVARQDAIGLLGRENLNGLHFDVTSVPPDSHLYLVGDGCVFLYQVPMSRLSYKTVFDVDTSDPHKTIVQDWLDKPVEVSDQQQMIVDVGELQRFSETPAYHIPPMIERPKGAKFIGEPER